MSISVPSVYIAEHLLWARSLLGTNREMAPLYEGCQSRAELRTGTNYLHRRPKVVPFREVCVECKGDSKIAVGVVTARWGRSRKLWEEGTGGLGGRG